MDGGKIKIVFYSAGWTVNGAVVYGAEEGEVLCGEIGCTGVVTKAHFYFP